MIKMIKLEVRLLKEKREFKALVNHIFDMIERSTGSPKNGVVLIRVINETEWSVPLFFYWRKPTDEQIMDCVAEAFNAQLSPIFKHEVLKRKRSRSVSLPVGKRRVQVSVVGGSPEENLAGSIALLSHICGVDVEKVMEENWARFPYFLDDPKNYLFKLVRALSKENELRKE